MAKNNAATKTAAGAAVDTNGDIPDSLEGINLRMNQTTDDVSIYFNYEHIIILYKLNINNEYFDSYIL